MEAEFDAYFVAPDEESSEAPVRRTSKVFLGEHSKQNGANGTVKLDTETYRDFVTSDEESAGALPPNTFKNNSRINSQENEADGTFMRETKMDKNFAASDEESSGILVLDSCNINSRRNLKDHEANRTVKPETERDGNAGKIMVGNIEVGFNEVQNGEEKLGSEGFEAEKNLVTTVEQTVRHGNKELIDEGSIAYSLSMGPSNESAVVTDMLVDSTHPKAPLEPSVYYVEDKGLWKCHHCSWVYPAIKPGIELIQKHKEHCEGMNNEKALFEQVFPIRHDFQKSSEINAILDRGSEFIDYGSKETEFVLVETVIQTMAEMEKNQNWPTVKGNLQSNYMDSETSTDVTQSFVTEKFNHIEKPENGKGAYLNTPAFSEIGSTAIGRNVEHISNKAQEKTDNEGVKEHKHGNSASEIILQNSQDKYVRSQDEQQLKEHWTRILEKSALEGKVEDIVNILKEQQSHDLICPICKSCITKRVILRKRKRTSLFSDDRWHQEANNDVQGTVSEGEDEIIEDQNVWPEISYEDGERTEAYGCLACFSLFFRRGVNIFETKLETGNNSLADKYTRERRQDSQMLVDKEKDSFYCLPFLYPWGHSVNKESKRGAIADFSVGISTEKSTDKAESSLKIASSTSSSAMADSPQMNKATSEGSAKNVVTESTCVHGGEKNATVDKIGLGEDDAYINVKNNNLDNQLNINSVSSQYHGAKADYAVGTSEKKGGKEAENISKITPSESNWRIADTLHENEAVSEVITATTVTGNILMNDGKKATTVNKVGLNIDDTDAENDKLDSKLNEAVCDKDHAAGEEFMSGQPNRTAGHPDIPIQNIWFQTCTTTKSTQTYSRSTENVEIRETNFTATETTKSTQYLNEDSEFPQLAKHYLRLPNVETSEGQLTMPASSSKPTVDGQTSQAEAKCKVPNESVPVKESDMQGQYLDKPDESKYSERQHPYHKDVKGTGDHLTELHFNGSAALIEEHQQVKIEQLGVCASTKHVDMFLREDTTMNEHMIPPHLVKQEQASNDFSASAAARDEGLSRSEQRSDNMKEDMAVRQGQSNKKDYLCSCIPVSIPAVWSIWSSKESIADQQLKQPFLANIKDTQTFDKKVPVALKDDQQSELISPLKSDHVESSSSFETRDPAFLAKSEVDDSVSHSKEDDSVSQSSEISPDSGKIVTSTDEIIATVIDIRRMHDPQPSNAGTAVSELKKKSSAQVSDLNVVTDWDILKSIVYGGLTVSITSLGVVSSAAGGEAKTLTVIAIGLSNLVAGLFLIFNNILYLDHFHQNEFKETVGDRFWFNGFVAILSYLIFGSLAPITYGFSFQKSDDRVYKFLATCLVSLLSIILLAMGKARVTKKSYIRIVIMYIVTGFWASIIGFFAGEYIKKLLEKWGFTTD